MTSAVHVVPSCSVTVRQQPLTAIESPGAASSSTSGDVHGQADGVPLVLDRGDGAELLDDAGEHQASSGACGLRGMSV